MILSKLLSFAKPVTLPLASLALAALLQSTTPAHAQTPGVPDALQSYIELALKQNPEVLAARARWDQADARVDQANSNLYPHIDFTSRYTTFEGGRIIDFGGNSFNAAQIGVIPWDTKLEAVWPIFNYAVWEGTKASKAYLKAATSEVSSKELAISYQVADAYFNYAKASELVTIRKNAVELAQQNLATAEALLRADKAAKNDVLRAEVAVASVKGDVLQAQNQQNLARTNFNNLLKRDYNAEIILPAPEAVSALVQSSAGDLASNDRSSAQIDQSFSQDYERALRGRPEVEQLTSAITALEGLRTVNSADYFPNVAVFGSYGWQEDKPKFSGDADYLAAGVQLKWNLFTGFGTNAKVAESKAQISELEYQKESLVNGVRIELQNARLERENASERRLIALKQVQSAEENRRITKAQYDAGQLPLITMIDAETTLSNARANLTVTTYDQLLADAKYRKALGIIK